MYYPTHIRVLGNIDLYAKIYKRVKPFPQMRLETIVPNDIWQTTTKNLHHKMGQCIEVLPAFVEKKKPWETFNDVLKRMELYNIRIFSHCRYAWVRVELLNPITGERIKDWHLRGHPAPGSENAVQDTLLYFQGQIETLHNNHSHKHTSKRMEVIDFFSERIVTNLCRYPFSNPLPLWLFFTPTSKSTSSNDMVYSPARVCLSSTPPIKDSLHGTE
ncbi:hypothetical protein BU23DRAFT_99283 [Bimuria novae-zelandiae CBS 107.79]|uniref:Uncharacterized protein n=1 Tax=Bimuria novae-zelandiae CBS 107.79 TaxID=1447943 RepID=A0A6A5VX85_9PLEO|nr:hypothetical protein BU23DRAFT_99283 [Bimuria novae-zelandiae CBS 107.79]